MAPFSQASSIAARVKTEKGEMIWVSTGDNQSCAYVIGGTDPV